MVAWKGYRKWSLVHLAQGGRPADAQVIWRAWCGLPIPDRAQPSTGHKVGDLCRRCLTYYAQSQEVQV